MSTVATNLKDIRIEVTATRRGWLPFVTVDHGPKRYCIHGPHVSADSAWRCAERMAAQAKGAA